jgi:tetratricopeptide (TPR) repeat protein
MKSRVLGRLFKILLFTAMASIYGCAAVSERSKPGVSFDAGPERFSGLVEQYRSKAAEHEKTGDLPGALRAWEVVNSLNPGDSESEKRIARLKKQIPAAARRHFQRGLTFFKNRSFLLARNEFLRTLYLKPDHSEALRYLKEKLAGEDFLTYEVRKAETPREIARNVYEDQQKGFLIAYFNGLREENPIEPPRILKMPIIEPWQPKRIPPDGKTAAEPKYGRGFDVEEALGTARTAYAKINYPQSAAWAEKILEHDPANREARDLLNSSYYQLGRQLGEERKHREALDALQRVDSGYKDTPALLARNRREIAEAHYLSGVKYFTQEKIEMAIQEWEAVLHLEPKHPMAQKDLDSARNLLQKLEKIK